MENKKKSKWSFLANLDVIVASVILAILIILTFAGVIWRYVFHAPFTWLEEVQTSCMGSHLRQQVRHSGAVTTLQSR